MYGARKGSFTGSTIEAKKMAGAMNYSKRIDFIRWLRPGKQLKNTKNLYPKDSWKNAIFKYMNGWFLWCIDVNWAK